MQLAELVQSLHTQGLGEHLILHIIKGKVILSNITYDKGSLNFIGKNYLADFNAEQLKPCWENGTLGMVSNSLGKECESLMFYGLKHCQIPVDLDSTRHGVMLAAENQFGDQLNEFVGSVYRGFQLMLDNNFLPVILFKPIKTTAGEQGLIVTDLRTTPMPISLIQTINDVIRQTVENQLAIGIDDADLNTGEFENLFGKFMSKD